MKHNFSTNRLKLFVGVLLLLPIFTAAQTTRYVKHTVSGTGDGSSWANASANIQDMINASSPDDEVWVAEGIYYPSKEPDGTTDSPRDFTFFLSNGVKLYGGFAGNETTISQRVLATNETTLSGDIGDSSYEEDNCYHVIISVNNGPSTIVDGFTVSRGHANGSDSLVVDGRTIFRNKGGGIYNNTSSPKITHSYFFANQVNTDGGGIYNYASSPTITNCSVSTNSAFWGVGAGICNEYGSSPIIDSTVFSFNQVRHTNIFGTSDHYGYGGAMYNSFSSPIISNCIFSENTPALKGAGIYNQNSSPIITNSIFYGNNAAINESEGYGGAIYNNSSSPTIINSNFFKNGSIYGGAIYDSASSPVIINSTFYNNSSNVSGDVIYNTALSSPTIKNSIIRKFIYQYPWIPAITNDNSTTLVTYSDVEQGHQGTGNIDEEPHFVNPDDPDGADDIFGTADDGYRLQSCSPLINAGDNTGVATTDITGAARIQLATVDMGAYESNSNSIDSTSNISIADTITTINMSQSPNGLTIYANDCSSLVATLKGDGSVITATGNVTAKLWHYDHLVDASGTWLAPRHYEIIPAINTSTATGRVTLYYTQMDFGYVNFYWSQLGLPGLPVLPDDAFGKAKLRILEYYGASNDGSGLINSYTNGSTTIDPADNDIVWNETQRRWEVSFDVTGFGGFFVQRALIVVPVKWISATANLNNQKQAIISWKVQEQNVLGYQVQQSPDGIHFSGISSVNSKGDGEHNYSLSTPPLQAGNYFYRIKQTSKDGGVSYSAVMKLKYDIIASDAIAIYPNPVKNNAIISLSLLKKQNVQYRLVDNAGRVLFHNTLNLNTGTTTIELPVANLSAGTYTVQVIGESFTKQIVLIKQ